MIKKGFTLMNALLSMVIISLLLLIVVVNFKPIDMNHHLFIADYLYNQGKAIRFRQRIDYPNNYSKHKISFNESGSVNMAQTVNIGNHKVIVHLGTGYLTYE